MALNGVGEGGRAPVAPVFDNLIIELQCGLLVL